MFARIVCALAVLALAPAAVLAQSWPEKPVTLVVPFTAGTTSDVVSRALAEHLGGKIGQSIVIDNRGGAGGNIGAAAVAKAAPDGYTLLMATTGPAATNKLMYKSLSFDPQKDFTPIVLVGKSPIIIVAKKDLPVSDLKALVEHLKANPDKLTAGYPGNGTLGHVTGELLQARTGTKIAAVQHRGSAPIINDLLGGHLDLGMDSMAAYVPQVLDGKIKALAIAGTARWAKLPNVPTVQEAGIPGFEASVWYALLAPAGTRSEIVAKLNAAVNDYLGTAKAKASFADLGIAAAGGTPKDLEAFTTAEIAKWAPIIESAKISF